MRRILAGWLLLMLAQEACAHDVSKGLKGLNPGKTAALDRVGALNLSLEAHQAFFSIVRRGSVWPTRSVSVCFGPADAVTNRQPLIEKIISVSNEWATGTKVAFDWGPNPTARAWPRMRPQSASTSPNPPTRTARGSRPS